MKPYDVLFDQALTRVDAERIHHAAFRAIRVAQPLTSRLIGAPHKGRVGASAPVQAMGLTFPHPLGLAAGFDKNAVGIDGLAALGFGHVEIGTVTGEAQPGNPQPRLFRLKADRAIVNRMGFNNDGAEVVARRLAARAEHSRRLDPDAANGRADSVVLGVNIGKTKVVPEEEAARDYEKSAGLLAPHAARRIVGERAGRLIPASMALGALFALLIDRLSTAFGPAELPVGLLSAAVGAPAFLILFVVTSRRS